MNEREPREREGGRHELERAVHTAFMQLPTDAAPPTLLPRVMAAVSRLRDRPWYARGWHTWPQSWQGASLAFCLLVLAFASAPAPATVGQWWSAFAGAPDARFVGVIALAEDAGRAARLADSLGAAAASIWRTFFAPLFVYAAVVSALLCAAVALFASALERLTPGKAPY